MEISKPDSFKVAVPPSGTQAHVPFLNLSALYLEHKAEFDAAIEDQLIHSRFIGGPELNAFEKEFAEWVGPGSHSVGCANGTDALVLAVQALNLPKGSKAILPAMTYVATLEAVLAAGLEVELVDVVPRTWLMDLSQLEKTADTSVKLIVPVHLYGQMAPMDKVREIANKIGASILEDAAQAHGARWKNQPVGHWGDIAGFSFFPGKNLGAFGDAGAILSRNENLIQTCRAIGNHGGIEKYVHERLGCNSRLDGLQATVLRIKLKYIDAWNAARNRVASQYLEGLSGISGLELPLVLSEARHVFHLFVVTVEDRVDFGAYLKANHIDTGIHYPKALHQHQAFQEKAFSQKNYPVAEKIAKHGISLPMCPTLTQAQVQHVVTTIRRYFGH